MSTGIFPFEIVGGSINKSHEGKGTSLLSTDIIGMIGGDDVRRAAAVSMIYILCINKDLFSKINK